MTPYRIAIETAADAHGLDPDLLAAIVEQESSGRFYAYRFEPAFYERYLKGKAEYAQWTPAECSASYGLCQVMFPTAREHGYQGQPWGLFDPAVSLEYGCRVLANLMSWARGLYTGLAVGERAAVMRSALAAFNGGKNGNRPTGPLRNVEYADQVLARYHRIREGSSA
jgi:soluble lytic murein transglycosylase-like protein